jgi:hypothetical protein
MKKQPSPEKFWKLEQASQANEMRTSDPVRSVFTGNCLHHYSQHGKSWLSNDDSEKPNGKSLVMLFVLTVTFSLISASIMAALFCK